MTKGEARDLYLRYLGEATVNGAVKADPDLGDQFEYLLPVAVNHLASVFPLRKVVTAEGEWEIPDDFRAIERIEREGVPVPYERVGDRAYRFEGKASITYLRSPAPVLPSDPDETALDLVAYACDLAPLKCAIDAAVASEAHAYKVGYLSATYNTMAAALLREDMPVFRRVYGL